MCTINPLMCWWYDHEEYWEQHPRELELAEAAIEAGFIGCQTLVSDWALKGEILERIRDTR